MVKQQDKSSPPVWVAIDVAKRRNEVLIEYPDRGRRQRLSVLNTREAHDRLMSCNIALSRLNSATRFFRRSFSSRNCLSSRTWSGSSPPYAFFQR